MKWYDPHETISTSRNLLRFDEAKTALFLQIHASMKADVEQMLNQGC